MTLRIATSSPDTLAFLLSSGVVSPCDFPLLLAPTSARQPFKVASKTTLPFTEPVFTVAEVASAYGWHYDTAKRYFRRVGGILRKPGIRTTILIPESVVRREWDNLTRRVHVQTPMKPRRPLTADEWSQIRALLAEGAAISSTAAKFGVTRQAIHKHLKTQAQRKA